MGEYKSKRQLVKFLRRLSHNTRSSNDSYGFLNTRIGNIPKELLTPYYISNGMTSFIISNEDLTQYKEVYTLLRKEPCFEYLKDNELDKLLWYVLCDVYLFRDFYLNSTCFINRIDRFYKEHSKPLVEYEIYFLIRDCDVAEGDLIYFDSTIKKYTRQELLEIGMKDLSFNKEYLLSEFTSRPLLILREVGNSVKNVVSRAQERAEVVLRFYKLSLLRSRTLRNEQLLFSLGDCALVKNLSNNWMGWSRTRSWEPWGVFIGEKLCDFLEMGDAQYNKIKKLSSNIQKVIYRALYWISKALEESEQDVKVILLCTAAETLLTQKHDLRKGEAIAYRMVLLHSELEKPHLMPDKILWIYELRSKTIHGSGLYEFDRSNYGTMQLMVRWTLRDFVEYCYSNSINKHSKFITLLEKSNKVPVILENMNKHNTDNYNTIRTALMEAVKKRKDYQSPQTANTPKLMQKKNKVLGPRMAKRRRKPRRAVVEAGGRRHLPYIIPGTFHDPAVEKTWAKQFKIKHNCKEK